MRTRGKGRQGPVLLQAKARHLELQIAELIQIGGPLRRKGEIVEREGIALGALDRKSIGERRAWHRIFEHLKHHRALCRGEGL